ncbi:MAG: hypothetical protein LBU97_02110 [Alistipes sp.]|jgi:hypothetical protein|nr:hypothetical protein [Alistipes sp.]
MTGMLIDPETGDLQVAGGSVVVGDNTAQVAEAILVASRGEFKEHPLLGAEIVRLQNGNGDAMWAASAKDMLHAAGVPVRRVRLDGNEITIE